MFMNRTQSLVLAAACAALTTFTAAGAEHRRTYQDLAAASDKVMLGTVGARSSYFGSDSRIYTDVVVSPDVTIEGDEEGAVVVQTLGGTVGDTRMSVSDGPELPEGERVIIFLKREADHFTVVGRSAGTVAASSKEAVSALDGAFTHAERRSGFRMSHRRGLAESYLLASGSSLRDRATTSAVQTGCYSVDGAKWNATSATYKIGPSIPSDWTASIDAAATTWSNAGASFRLVNDSSSVNEFSYVDLVAKYGSSYNNTYAVTTTWSTVSTHRITRATTEVGTKWQWSPSGAAGMADVQNIMTHELGHWMRLLDIYSPTTCSDVTMWGTASLGETKKRTLDGADISGFMSLYGGSGTTLGTPILSSPANGATGVSATPMLAWTAATNATSYDVYLGNTSSPPLVATGTGTTYQPGSLTAGATYFWRVVAKNATSTASSDVFSFTVVGGATSGPTLISPADGATGVSLTPIMQWSAVSGALTYDIYVGTTPTPGRIGSVNATSVRVTGFRSNTVYYWKIVARTAAGSLSSAVASFRTN
jgi:hypothetical protein